MCTRDECAIRTRRGTVSVAVLIALLLAGLIVVGMVRVGARDQDLSYRRLQTVQAFYAAEAGTNMAFRELMLGADEDGDGTAGSVSDDGNDGNDPVFGPASVAVTLGETGSSRTLVSLGCAGTARREITVTLD